MAEVTYDVGVLDRIEVGVTDVGDPPLICTDCGETICTVEYGDRMDVLVSTAAGHVCEEREFTATVTITCRNAAQAARVLAERLSHDEDYGFDYSVGCSEVRPPTDS